MQMRAMGCEFVGYLNYPLYFHIVSFRNIPFPICNTGTQYTFNSRLVEKGNECFVYLKLTQFSRKIESFVYFRSNNVYLIVSMELLINGHFKMLECRSFLNNLRHAFSNSFLKINCPFYGLTYI